MINADRLLQNLHELRGFGRSGNGVVRRCLSPIDIDSRHWLVAKMQAAGLDASIDGIANVIGYSPNPGEALLLGSHSDTQLTGGWLDGALGVIYSIEVAQALNEQDDGRPFAIDVASWADEESHYLGMMGSRSFCDELDEAEIDAAHNSEGHGLRAALAQYGLDKLPRLHLQAERYLGYLEAHIEQGPWLELEHRRIGVVTSIVGMRDLNLSFHGQQNHAGTTPMHLRQDAAMALFEFVQDLNQAFSGIRGDHSVWTIGQLRLTPNAPSIVPGMAECNLQFRDPEQARIEAMQQCAFALVDEFNRKHALEARISLRDESACAVDMDENLQAALAQAAQRLAPDSWRHMPSGAAHDAQVLAAHLPTGMLFIPSIDGISHDFAEDSREDDIVLGCEVFADAARNLLEHQQTGQ
ncbi:MAG: hydantoinase/carbamoylase family amidase [Gammaproteobacteria bacterium]|nr:hydantoinase/carbamoylase family amidase [Gammaproteobacteria bacterium]